MLGGREGEDNMDRQAMGGLGAMGGDDMDRKASNGFCCHMKYAPNDSVEITTNL